MDQKIRYVHTNLIAYDWKQLASFYIDVFGCQPMPPERNLHGDWLGRLTSLENPHIRGIHLALPGYTGEPTLEIFSYEDQKEAEPRSINAPGFGHIAFHVDDVPDLAERIQTHGGSLLGEIVVQDYPEQGTLTVAYCRDPEGNFIEVQNWKLNE